MALVPEAVPAVESGFSIQQSDFLFLGPADGRGQVSISRHR